MTNEPKTIELLKRVIGNKGTLYICDQTGRKDGVSSNERPMGSATGSSKKATNLKKKADRKAAPSWTLKIKTMKKTKAVCSDMNGANPKKTPKAKPEAI